MPKKRPSKKVNTSNQAPASNSSDEEVLEENIELETEDELEVSEDSIDILDFLPENMKGKVTHLESVGLYITEVDPRTLNDNPKNWRVHTRRQRATYSAFKEKHGWLSLIIYNLKTNRLLDGHMRVDEAIKNKEPFVPVILKYVSEKQENEILATFDNIGLLAKRNTDALQSLLKANEKATEKVKTQHDQKLQQFTKDLEEFNVQTEKEVVIPQSKAKVKPPKVEPEPEPEEIEVPEGYAPKFSTELSEEVINSDVLFEGETWLGIPQLRSDQLAKPEDAPSRTYAREAYGTDAYYCISSGPFAEGEDIGTIGFYTEDWRFEQAYENAADFAEKLNDLDPVALLTPDFSTYMDWPGAMRVWNLYRSRWCGRFWQELGFQIIPSLQGISFDTTQDLELAVDTLPQDCPVLSLQCRMASVEGLIKYINRVVQVRKPEVFLLYGGEEKQKYFHGYLPSDIDFRYLMQFTEKRRIQRKRNIKTEF